jgi:hypothetical protein
MSILVLRLTNQERAKRGFAPLNSYAKLDRIAHFHSVNMAVNGFFAHDDAQGRGPQERMSLLCPELIGGAGENLALMPRGGEEWLANSAVAGWMNSSGHRRNILSADFTHLGIGFAHSGRGVYLTQSFASLSVELGPQAIAQRVRYGKKCVLPFIFLGRFPRPDLTFHLEAPDPNAMQPAGNGLYFRGAWPLPIVWGSERAGETEFAATHGRGSYRLFAGRKAFGQYAPVPFLIEVS